MINPINLRPFKHFCITIGNLPTSYVDSLSYYEMLEWLCHYLQDTVIPAVNTNADAVTELQGLYVELKNYVDTYFENLDVQEEINNKLDQMAEDGILQEIIESYISLNSIITFNSVSDMKASESLVSGMTVKTMGYYEVGDLGGATYRVREITNDDVVDDASIIALHDDSLIAELVLNSNVLNVRQFGVKEDNTTDDSDNLQKAFDFIGNHLNISLQGNEKYSKITKTLDLKVYTKVSGIWLMMEEGSYINNYLLYINSNSTHNDWQQSYPQYIGYLKNCKFKNNTANNYNGIFNYSNGAFEDLIFDSFDISFRNATKYLDSYKMTRIYTDNKKTSSNYAVYLGYLGDQCSISELHLHSGLYQLFVGQGHNGIVINNCIIHGIINIESSNVTFNNLHQESTDAIINIKNSIVKISNAYIDHNTNASEHNFEIVNNSHVILENIKFNYNLVDGTDNSTDDIDINITSGEVDVINCFKRPRVPSIDENNLCVAKTNLGLSLNTKQFYSTNNILMTSYNTNQVNVAHGAFASLSAGSRATWKITSGTYYYKIQPIGDFDRRIAYSQNVNSYNMALTQGQSGFLMRAHPGCYRIYRGTSANSYNKYVDICHINEYLLDDGNMLNGYLWQDRTAGDIDSFQYLSRIEYIGDKKSTYFDGDEILISKEYFCNKKMFNDNKK